MTNILKNNLVKSAGAILFVVAAMCLSGLLVARANPGGFPPGARTATATSTPTALSNGSGVSTVVYDAYNINGTNQGTTGVTTDTDSASLLVQFTASSTASKLKIAFEFSQDGIDWYADGTSVLLASSTTGTVIANTPDFISWTFASTSLNGASIAANNNFATELFNAPTPARYVRSVITATGGNALVWAQFVPKKQQP